MTVPESLRLYLTKVERLGEEGVAELLKEGEVAPPLTRRRYHLSMLAMSSTGQH